jgi:hypothetical protein
MNASLDLLEKECRSLVSRLFEVEGQDTEEERAVQRVVDEFLVANASLMEAAARAYAELSDTQRVELANQHNLTTTVLHGQNPDANTYVAHALHGARVHKQMRDAGLEPLPFAKDLIDMIPRVLSYAKYVAKATDPVSMAPVARYLPRRWERHATVEAVGGKGRITINVSGGLIEENQADFEKIAFPDGLAIKRELAISAPHPATAEKSPLAGFCTTLLCPTSSVKAVVTVLQEHGFRVQGG